MEHIPTLEDMHSQVKYLKEMLERANEHLKEVTRITIMLEQSLDKAKGEEFVTVTNLLWGSQRQVKRKFWKYRHCILRILLNSLCYQPNRYRRV